MASVSAVPPRRARSCPRIRGQILARAISGTWPLPTTREPDDLPPPAPRRRCPGMWVRSARALVSTLCAAAGRGSWVGKAMFEPACRVSVADQAVGGSSEPSRPVLRGARLGRATRYACRHRPGCARRRSTGRRRRRAARLYHSRVPRFGLLSRAQRRGRARLNRTTSRGVAGRVGAGSRPSAGRPAQRAHRGRRARAKADALGQLGERSRCWPRSTRPGCRSRPRGRRCPAPTGRGRARTLLDDPDAVAIASRGERWLTGWPSMPISPASGATAPAMTC